jgi:hypothetical protein
MPSRERCIGLSSYNINLQSKAKGVPMALALQRSFSDLVKVIGIPRYIYQLRAVFMCRG